MAEKKPIVAQMGEVLAPTSDPRPITIQDAIDAYKQQATDRGTGKGQINKVVKVGDALESVGYSLDTPISEINNQDAMARIASWSRDTKTIKSSGMFGSNLKTLIGSVLPEGVSNAVSVYEEKNRGTKPEVYTPKEFGIRSTRLASKLALPDIDTFHQAIHRAAMSIEDKEARAALLLKLHTGLRNPDIFQLSLEAERGGKYGTVDTKSGTIYNLSNKAKRINYDLGQEAHGILKDLADDARAAGRSKIFSKSEATLRNKINAAVRSQLESADAQIIDTKTGEAKPFSINTLRKNIFDIIEDRMGTSTANQVLGHSSKGDVGLTHYKVSRLSKQGAAKVLSRVQKATELFSSIYSESIGQSNPKELYGSRGYGFNETNFQNTFRVTPDVQTPAPVQQVELAETRVETGIESKVDTSIERIENKISKLDELNKKLEAMEPSQPEAATGSVPETKGPTYTEQTAAAIEGKADTSRSDASKKRAALKKLAKGTKAVGAIVAPIAPPVGLGLYAAGSVLATAEAAPFAKQAGETAARAGLTEDPEERARLRGESARLAGKSLATAFSPIPLEERTPEQEKFLRESREIRAQRMQSRRERATSAQMDELMSKQE